MAAALIRAPCSGVLVEEFFGIECRHAAEAGRGDGLSVDLIGDIAGREYPWNRGCGSATLKSGFDAQVAVAHVQLAFEQRCVRGVSNGNEKPM